MTGPERAIETHLRRQVEKRGGWALKFYPLRAGNPDRIVILPNGRTVYVELKTEIGRLAKVQQWQIERLRQCGADVRVLKGMEQVNAFLEEVRSGAVCTA